MEDGLKISKDKRHRSSSSLAGVGLEGTRSERKLDIRVSIPEVDDQFVIAEARCDNLQDQIDLVKSLKKKRKIKKRSMTRVNEPQQMDNIPLISVMTQPKKKVTMQSTRLRRVDVPVNAGGFRDTSSMDQRRPAAPTRVDSYATKPTSQKTRHTKSKQSLIEVMPSIRNKSNRLRGDGGDNSLGDIGSGLRRTKNCEVACGEDKTVSSECVYNESHDAISTRNSTRDSAGSKQHVKAPDAGRRKTTPRDNVSCKATKNPDLRKTNEARRQQTMDRSAHYSSGTVSSQKREDRERPVVELFNKNRRVDDQQRTRLTSADTSVTTNAHEIHSRHNREEEQLKQQIEEHVATSGTRQSSREFGRQTRRIRCRSRRYELPTVASQMKQAGMRYYYGSNNLTNIPFIVSKSTAPSHNIGVNIQQVLNGLKIQQPLSGIPFTIAHHMGLGHIPHYRKQSAVPARPSLDAREMNAIRFGQKLVRLPSYKYMSYNRLLDLYREGEGMVPRFLRAISRPHYFYTSMYNLSTRVDYDGATSKGRGATQEAKQSLAEYAALYREYEGVERCIREGEYEPDLERRKDELARELALREEHIRKVVQEYRTSPETEPATTLRASLSTADESYRHSGFRFNLNDHQL